MGLKVPARALSILLLKKFATGSITVLFMRRHARIPQELMDLVSALQDALSVAGFSIERRTYSPHITLIRKASCRTLPELAEPIAWRAIEWMLVKSEQTSDGSVYSPIGRWPLEISE